ncbi:MAG: L-rhamnose/proton symporter RhaT [Limisphaerales bacterium]|jgi:L-rhamnose-H+ transport protein|nr:L-rhamnose/proton symporter RhaT [Verrucomicrobiota bacterium]
MDATINISNPAVNPALGIFIFMLGGLAGAVFYLPFKKVTQWAWESYWFVYALFGLVIVPWIITAITSPNVLSVLKEAPYKEIFWCYIFGAMWGFGGLTWGLMIRYLGVGLGLALGCGICSAAGTLLPPIFKGQLEALTATSSACVALCGVAVSVVGIVLIGGAGISKEKELPEEEKKKAVAEYSFKKGIIAALFSGLMSAGMAYGLNSGAEIQRLAIVGGTSHVWQGMPVLVVVLLGGFTVNGIWCLALNLKNKTLGDYTNAKAPLVGNVIFAGIAGAIWVMQFVCNKAGEPSMGDKAYVGWAVLMASTILFSTILGILLGEWKGTGNRTKALLGIGITVLLGSSVITGWSGYLGLEKEKETQINIPANIETLTLSDKETIQLATQNIHVAGDAIQNMGKAITESDTSGNVTIIKADPSVTSSEALRVPAPAPMPVEGVAADRK